jgi:hypothetical protein
MIRAQPDSWLDAWNTRDAATVAALVPRFAATMTGSSSPGSWG